MPWSCWDFRSAAAGLDAQTTSVIRGREGDLALGLEYRAKAACARAIAAVAVIGGGDPTLRSLVAGLTTRGGQDLVAVLYASSAPLLLSAEFASCLGR